MRRSVERVKERQRSRRAKRDKVGDGFFGSPLWDVFDWIELVVAVIGAVLAGVIAGLVAATVGLFGCGSG